MSGKAVGLPFLSPQEPILSTLRIPPPYPPLHLSNRKLHSTEPVCEKPIWLCEDNGLGLLVASAGYGLPTWRPIPPG